MSPRKTREERKAEKTKYLGVRIQHHPEELEYLWNHLDATAPKTVVEIGTATGGLSVIFGLWCHLNDAHTVTIDITSRKQYNFHKKILRELGVTRIVANAWKPRTVESVREMLEHPAFIYCDGGNKKMDLDIYAPLLEEGDYIACHDSNNPRMRNALKKLSKKHGLTTVDTHLKIAVMRKVLNKDKEKTEKVLNRHTYRVEHDSRGAYQNEALHT